MSSTTLTSQITLGEATDVVASPRARLHRRILRDHRAMVGGLILAGITVLAITAPVLPIASPSSMDLMHQLRLPSWRHPLGTDSFGRDILSRVIFGARVSLLVGFVSVGFALLFGATSGVFAGFRGGAFDAVIMRIMDAFLAFPPILLAVALVGALGSGEFNVMLGLGVVYMPTFARIARAKVITIRQSEFVMAARSSGASDTRLLLRHVVPNSLGPIIVQAAVAYAFAIIAEAGLSFLGLGVPPSTPSWGAMLTEARKFIQTSPWFSLMPGAALSITVLCITLLGDSLRELLDPTGR